MYSRKHKHENSRFNNILTQTSSENTKSENQKMLQFTEGRIPTLENINPGTNTAKNSLQIKDSVAGPLLSGIPAWTPASTSFINQRHDSNQKTENSPREMKENSTPAVQIVTEKEVDFENQNNEIGKGGESKSSNSNVVMNNNLAQPEITQNFCTLCKILQVFLFFPYLSQSAQNIVAPAIVVLLALIIIVFG